MCNGSLLMLFGKLSVLFSGINILDMIFYTFMDIGKIICGKITMLNCILNNIFPVNDSKTIGCIQYKYYQI